MIVPFPVVAHGGAAGDLPDHVQSDVLFLLFHRGGSHRKIQTAQCLTKVSASAFGKVGAGVLIHLDPDVLPFGKLLQGVVKPLFHVRRRQRLELKHSAPGQQRIIDVEIGVFGGGGNEGHRAVLDALQQALLLLFVQVLDLIQIQQDAPCPCQCADVLQHCLDIPGAAGGAVELMQGHAAVLGNDPRHGGLAGAGGSVEDHIGNVPAFDGAPEHPSRCQQMLLPADIRQCFGAQALRQRLIHPVHPPLVRCRKYPLFSFSIAHFSPENKILSENDSQIRGDKHLKIL